MIYLVSNMIEANVKESYNNMQIYLLKIFK